MTGSNLKDKVTLQTLERDEVGNWSWKAAGQLYAQAKQDDRKNLFSSIGIGARGATFCIRKRKLTLHDSFLWRGQHCFLTSILPTEGTRGFLTVKAALVTPRIWTADADLAVGGPAFPGVITEMYVRHDTPDFHSEVHGRFVLVTPKAIELAPGSWVASDGKVYRVETPHLLDDAKNEYEILRREDC